MELAEITRQRELKQKGCLDTTLNQSNRSMMSTPSYKILGILESTTVNDTDSSLLTSVSTEFNPLAISARVPEKQDDG